MSHPPPGGRHRPPAPRPVLAAVLALLATLLWQEPPAAPSARQSFRFAVLGDSGTGKEPQRRVARQMARWHETYPFSLVLMLGDNIYGGFLGLGGGHRKDFPKKFDQPYAPLLARGVIFRAALGNHDMSHREGKDLIESYERFHIEGEKGYYQFSTSEREGAGDSTPLVDFFALNTVRLKRGDPQQVGWLQEALQTSRARWRIVFGHHPLYSTGKGWFHGPNRDLQRLLEPLWSPPSKDSPALVDVVLAGHDHFYQRWQARRGVLYFVCGAGGKLDRGGAAPDPQVAAEEDRRRSFMLWEVRREALLFLAIHEGGEAFDCGQVAKGGKVTSVPCPTLPPSP